MEPYAYALCGIMVLISAALLRKAKNGDGNDVVADALASLSERLENLKTTPEPPVATHPALMERVEALERRVDAVHKDCLSYLQKAAAAENRMKQRMEAAEEEAEDGELTEAQARALLASEEATQGQGNGRKKLTRSEIEAMINS